MVANVAHVGGSEESVADGMDKNIGVAVAKETKGVGYLYAAKP